MKTDKVPALAIPRLSLYYRALLESRGSDIISSDEIAKQTGYTAAQVRRDLAYFGQFGTPGRGYPIEGLKKSILGILGTDRTWHVALVGVGNLGSALLSYRGFVTQGFKITRAFDTDLRKIGKTLEGVLVQDINELDEAARNGHIHMAIVAVPAAVAQLVVDRLVKSGIKAILNFAPIRPQVADTVRLLNIDLSIELERLAHFLTKLERDKGSM